MQAFELGFLFFHDFDLRGETGANGFNLGFLALQLLLLLIELHLALAGFGFGRLHFGAAHGHLLFEVGFHRDKFLFDFKHFVSFYRFGFGSGLIENRARPGIETYLVEYQAYDHSHNKTYQGTGRQ